MRLEKARERAKARELDEKRRFWDFFSREMGRGCCDVTMREGETLTRAREQGVNRGDLIQTNQVRSDLLVEGDEEMNNSLIATETQSTGVEQMKQGMG